MVYNRHLGHDRDIYIIEQGLPQHTIVEETCIKLTALVGDQDLKVSFDRYGLG